MEPNEWKGKLTRLRERGKKYFPSITPSAASKALAALLVVLPPCDVVVVPARVVLVTRGLSSEAVYDILPGDIELNSETPTPPPKKILQEKIAN